MGSRKMVLMYWWIYLQGNNGETDIKSRPIDKGKGRRERIRCMARVTWKFTIPYLKEIANGNLLYDSGNSKLYDKKGGIEREMGRRSRREGTFVYLWLILHVWQKTTKFCKAIILQLKNKEAKKRNKKSESVRYGIHF